MCYYINIQQLRSSSWKFTVSGTERLRSPGRIFPCRGVCSDTYMHNISMSEIFLTISSTNTWLERFTFSLYVLLFSVRDFKSVLISSVLKLTPLEPPGFFVSSFLTVPRLQLPKNQMMWCILKFLFRFSDVNDGDSICHVLEISWLSPSAFTFLNPCVYDQCSNELKNQNEQCWTPQRDFHLKMLQIKNKYVISYQSLYSAWIKYAYIRYTIYLHPYMWIV